LTDKATTTAGAEDVDAPEWCEFGDEDDTKTLADWRQLTLLIARARAAINADEAPSADAVHYVEQAEYFAELRDSDDDDDEDREPNIDVDTDFSTIAGFCRDGIVLAQLSLDCSDSDESLGFGSAKWDLVVEAPDDEDEDMTPYEDMARALTAARRIIGVGAKPQIAVKLLAMAEEKRGRSDSNRRSGDYGDAQHWANEAKLYAGLAEESAQDYGQEKGWLLEGRPSTFDERILLPKPDYTSFENDDSDDRDGKRTLRKFVLKAARAEAFIDAKCPGFKGAKGVTATVETLLDKVNDGDDWSEVTNIANSGMIFINAARETANRSVEQ
jgi:hypothetical protein